MNVTEAIESRRSVKHYDPEHVMPEEDLAELIRLVKLAPSSFNMQNYRLLVIRDPELRKEIRAAAWDQAQVTDASVLFIICADLDSHNEDPAVYWSHAPQEVQDILGPMIKPFYEGKEQLIRDGRGGGTGAAPLLFRNHISVPTIPALARARHHLDKLGASDRVTLIITGGLRTHTDFAKAMALGADGVAVSNSAMQAIGCVGARICNANLCPAGIATQKPELRRRLKVDVAAKRLANFFEASFELMQVMSRACGHDHLNQFNKDDIASWDKALAELAGIDWSGFNPNR